MIVNNLASRLLLWRMRPYKNKNYHAKSWVDGNSPQDNFLDLLFSVLIPQDHISNCWSHVAEGKFIRRCAERVWVVYHAISSSPILLVLWFAIKFIITVKYVASAEKHILKQTVTLYCKELDQCYDWNPFKKIFFFTSSHDENAIFVRSRSLINWQSSFYFVVYKSFQHFFFHFRFLYTPQTGQILQRIMHGHWKSVFKR